MIKKETQACLGHTAFPNHSCVEMEFHPKPGKLQQNTLLGASVVPCMHAFQVAQLCLTLCNLMDCSLPGSSIHGIFQATVLEWGAMACPILCDPVDWSTSGFPVHHQLLELLKLMSIELGMPTNHLLLCLTSSSCLQSFPASQSFPMSHFFASGGQSIGVSASASVLSNEYSGLISFRMDWLNLLQSKGLSRVFSNTTDQKHQFFSTQPSLWSSSHIHTWVLEKS